VNAFILAGGLSTRMGRDKALLEVNGRPLIVHALEKLRSLGFTPRIAASRPDLERFAPVIPDRLASDQNPDYRRGPLAGIEAALSASDSPLNLFLPVDLPLVPIAFLAWLVERAEITQALATISCLTGRRQPLCAVYSRELLPGLTASLAAGNYKVQAAVEHALRLTGGRLDCFHLESIAAALPAGRWPAEPPLHQWFRNLNTPEELIALEQTASIH
jgi:molybdopterin-guanine dinucleotide biosynthesis protein A